MAESKNNVVTHGLTGLVGDMLVFRNRGGKTFVSTKPKERTGEPSENQKQQQERFQDSILYAKAAIADPAIKAEYAKAITGNETAYNIAVADFFHAPEVKSVDLIDYTGKVGDKIMIRAVDDFKVVEVSVSILTANDTVVEHGKAVCSNGVDWMYTATVVNETLAGTRVVVCATDMPGNITEVEQEM